MYYQINLFLTSDEDNNYLQGKIKATFYFQTICFTFICEKSEDKLISKTKQSLTFALTLYLEFLVWPMLVG